MPHYLCTSRLSTQLWTIPSSFDPEIIPAFNRLNKIIFTRQKKKASWCLTWTRIPNYWRDLKCSCTQREALGVLQSLQMRRSIDLHPLRLGLVCQDFQSFWQLVQWCSSVLHITQHSKAADLINTHKFKSYPPRNNQWFQKARIHVSWSRIYLTHGQWWRVYMTDNFWKLWLYYFNNTELKKNRAKEYNTNRKTMKK